jgi:hypothetical protein
MLVKEFQDLRFLNFDDLWIIYGMSKDLTNVEISKLLLLDRSCIRKKILRIKSIFGEDYFFQKKCNSSWKLSNKGKKLAITIDAFMISISNIRSLKEISIDK